MVEVELLEHLIDLEIDYSVYGMDKRANLIDPAESVEVEINGIHRVFDDVVGDVDVMSFFDSDELGKILELTCEAIFEH